MIRRKAADTTAEWYFTKIQFIKIETKQKKQLKNSIKAGMMTTQCDIETVARFIGLSK
jgi:hypothetical protein